MATTALQVFIGLVAVLSCSSLALPLLDTKSKEIFTEPEASWREMFAARFKRADAVVASTTDDESPSALARNIGIGITLFVIVVVIIAAICYFVSRRAKGGPLCFGFGDWSGKFLKINHVPVKEEEVKKETEVTQQQQQVIHPISNAKETLPPISPTLPNAPNYAGTAITVQCNGGREQKTFHVSTPQKY